MLARKMQCVFTLHWAIFLFYWLDELSLRRQERTIDLRCVHRGIEACFEKVAVPIEDRISPHSIREKEARLARLRYDVLDRF